MAARALGGTMANITYDLQVRYAPPELSLSRALLRVEYLTSWLCVLQWRECSTATRAPLIVAVH